MLSAAMLALGLAALAARSPWQVGESVCHSFVDFQAVDLYPIRSPLVVADALSAVVRGASFCEIGTRNGDVMSCLSHFASRLTSIEMDTTYCRNLRKRGIEVTCAAVEDINPSEFPIANVYYWWPVDAEGQNELWLHLVMRALHARRQRATVYVGYDTHWKPDMGNLPKLVRRYNGTVERLFFDEGGSISGQHRLGRGAKHVMHAFEASYARPFYDRPGHWGVFHLARFELGPEDWEQVRSRGPRRRFEHPALDGSGMYSAEAIAERRRLAKLEESKPTPRS